MPNIYMKSYGICSWDEFLYDFREHWPTDVSRVSVGQLREGYARTGDRREFWLTEQWTAGAESVFQFDAPGQVATAMHAGIPWLLELRCQPQLRSRVHFWPFNGFDVPGGKSMIAEMHPAVFRNRCGQPGSRSRDEHGAYSATAWVGLVNSLRCK